MVRGQYKYAKNNIHTTAGTINPAGTAGRQDPRKQKEVELESIPSFILCSLLLHHSFNTLILLPYKIYPSTLLVWTQE